MEGGQKIAGNYLVFDGGRSALSALYMIEEICSRLQFDLNADDEIRLCAHCDLLGGSGTGAVAAILLGRMGLTASQAIDAYQKLELALSVQTTKDEDERRRNSEAFKVAFTEVLVEAGFTTDTPMLDQAAPKTVVWTLNAANLSVLQPIRSYRVGSAPGPPFTILEAACASVASPDKFPPFTTGTSHKKITLVDATVGYANPTKELLQEAQRVFGENAEVASIVSLGAGKGGVLSITGSDDAGTLMEAMTKMALDSEQTHKEMMGQMDASTVHAHTSAYMQDGDTDQLLNNVVKSIKSRQKGTTLKEINSVAAVEITLKPRPSLVENFVGREDILEALETTHFSSRPPEMRKPAVSVLMGLGGSGKTQTALRFALNYEGRYRDASVYFFNASSEAKLKADFELAIHARDSASHSNSYDDAFIWFTGRKDDWLIIMDNADDPLIDLFRYIPKSSHDNIIITSRNATHRKLAPTSSHYVEGLSSTDASTLILKGSSYPDNEANRAYALLIGKELGYLPLALAHAAAYISDHQCLSTYLTIYHERRAKFLATRPVLLEDYTLSVGTAIQMSLDSVSATACDVMALLSRLDATLISQIVIEKAAERQFRHIDGRSEGEALHPETIEAANALMTIFCPSGAWLESDFNDIVRECLQYSLLQVATQGETRFYSMHVLVQAYLRSISTTIREHRPEQIIARLLGSSITVDLNYKYQAFNRLLVPHLKLVAADDIVEAGDHFGYGHVLYEQGNALLSTTHFERCLAIRRSILGDENMGTVDVMYGLAVCYIDAGRYQEALDLGVKVLDLGKQISGDEHPNTLRAMGNIASSYSYLGRHQESLELRAKVLDLRRRVSGDEHPDTLIAMGNLAVSYDALRRHQEALMLKIQVLDLRKRVSGDEHPNTLIAMGNLAWSYSRLGKHEEALELGVKVLGLQKRISGDENLSTVRAMGNLATYYSVLGRHQEALEYQEKVLEMRRQLLGDEHRKTLITMWGLSATSHKLGMRERAIALLQAAIPLQEKTRGVDHPDTKAMKQWPDHFLETPL